MDFTFRFLGGLARRLPAVAALVKPLLLPLIHHLLRVRSRVSMVDRQEEEANAYLAAMIDSVGSLGVGAKADGRDVLMLVVSDLRIDPRVRSEAMALAEAGYRVTVVCPSPFADTQMPPVIDWGKGVDICYVSVACGNYLSVRPGFEGGLLYDVIAREFADRSFLAVHAHDLNTAYVALAFARLKGAHLVVDFHEWTSENVHWDDVAKSWLPYPQDWKEKLQALERRIMRQASAVITVCDSIADAIAEELGNGRCPHVIRNIPALSALTTKNYCSSLKEQLGLNRDQFLLLWQGGTGPTRLIEPIIAALEFAPDCVFAIRGPSLETFGPQYMAIAEEAGAGDRLILLDPVSSSDVVGAARGADAGVWSLPRLCRNFTYALPNKIFEYTASNLALLVADYPEARRMVETYCIGLAFDPYDPRSIAVAINRLIGEPGLASGFRANTHAALESLDAESEWKKLVTLYDALPRNGGAVS